MTVVLRALLMTVVFGSLCAAYQDNSHLNIVRDAFEFVIANRSDTQTKYPDGSTPKSDYELFLRVLAIKPDASANERLRQIALQLGQESANTDKIEDVTLSLPHWYL